MSFSAPGTILLEENNIRYQIYSDQYYESTLKSIIDSRVKKTDGNVYTDFSVDEDIIRQDSEECLNETVLKIIAIDLSKETPTVISQMLGLDFTTFISGCNKTTSYNVFNIIDKKLLEPLKDIQYKYGDIMIGTSLGVMKEYQHLNIGYNLGMLFLKAFFASPYKMIAGFIYNQKVVDVLSKIGALILNEVKAEDCSCIDKNIGSYMKNSFQLVAFVDYRKDVSTLQLPQNFLIRPSL